MSGCVVMEMLSCCLSDYFLSSLTICQVVWSGNTAFGILVGNKLTLVLCPSLSLQET